MWVVLVMIGGLLLALAVALVGFAVHRQRVEVALLIEARRRPAALTYPVAGGWSGRVKLSIAAAAAGVLGLLSLCAAVHTLPR